MQYLTPVPAFDDNYIWALCQHDNSLCIIVDPGDANAVQQFLQQNNKTLAAILVTHHHQDHIGGLSQLNALWPDAPIIGPAAEQHRITALTQTVTEGDQVKIPAMKLTFNVIELPGHTLGHIAYYSAPVLFCGDTLFSAGCGRLFEGTPQQMYHSLQKLAALPDDTTIYCTHEYTLANLQFAAFVEPDNSDITQYQQLCIEKRHNNQPTLPSSLALEKQVNPFLRCNNKTLQRNWAADSAINLFSQLRAAKDHFKS